MTSLLAAAARRAWDGERPADRALRAALRPVALAYGAVVTVRNHLYDRGWLAATRVPAQVLSVGNLSVGGTGKTPAALWLATALAARGRRVGIVARGYRKQRRGVVVVGTDGLPLVSAEEGGDEAVMLARRFAGPVVTGEERAAAAAAACRQFALDTIVLDDGFQHRRLARDADLVLLGPEASASLLPAGPLREPPGSLRRARAVLAVDPPPGTTSRAGGPPFFRARLRPTALVRARAGRWEPEPLTALAGGPVTAVAGVAHPERFAATLARAGATVAEVLPFPDHHRYSATDVARLSRAAAGGLVVTTEKDLVKLDGHPELGAIRALRVELEVENGDALVELLVERR